MPKSLRFLTAFAFTHLSLTSSAFCQYSLLFQINGAPSDRLGNSVAGAGDVNGDGVNDFIIGAPGTSVRGAALVVSGLDGIVLHAKYGFTGRNWLLGYSVDGAGDVDNDRKADFLIGSPGDSIGSNFEVGSAFLYSGGTGALLYRSDGSFSRALMGWAVAGAGDVNGDSTLDYIISSPGGIESGQGSVYVRSGVSGNLLYQKNGSSGGDNLGYSVDGIGDVNGDGKPDFIIGARFAGSTDAGSAYVYSGANGQLLFQKNGTGSSQFGLSVAGIGDVNNDGRPDFIVGAPFASPSGLIYSGSAFVYSGSTGGLLYQKNGSAAGDAFGFSVAGAGDIDGDGTADFIIGAVNTDPAGLNDAGSAYIYSGATGNLLFQVNGIIADGQLGFSVAGIGDISGDGKSDFIIGAATISQAFVYGICVSFKGDINSDSIFTPADVVLMINCVFLQGPICRSCLTDVNCDGILTSSDVVLELNRVFLGLTDPPWCGT